MWQNFLAQIVRQIINVVSPQLKEALQRAIKQLETTADETDNPWDDIAVDALKFLIGM